MKKYHYISKEKYRSFALNLLEVLLLTAGFQLIKNSPEDTEPTYLPPVVVLTDTCPPPEIRDLQSLLIGESISIVKTADGSFELRNLNGGLITDMIPPTIHKAAAPIGNFTNYHTEDGLALNTIYCGLRDKKGNLWFGSEGGGLSRFNGKGFTNYTVTEGLADNTVRGLVEDKSGKIWIATDAGLSSYDGQKFVNYGVNEGFLFGAIRSMIIDKNGKLWMGTLGTGVVSFDPTAPHENGFSKLDIPIKGVRMVRAIREDKYGNLWIGNWGGIIRYNPNVSETSKNRFTSYSTENGLSGNEIWSMLEDSQGNMWIGTLDGGVSRFLPEKDKPGHVCFETYTVEDGLADNFVRNMFEDDNGNIWFCTLEGGVSRLDPAWDEKNGLLFTNYTTARGLTSNSIYYIIDDIDGNLWFCTRNRGVDRYNDESIFTYDFEQGLFPNRVRSVLEDKKGNIWLGVEDRGFSRFDGEYYINYSLRPSLSFLSMSEERNGTLWFAGYGVTFRFIPSPDGSGSGILSAYSIGGTGGTLQDSEGSIWIGQSGRGLKQFDGSHVKTYTPRQGLADFSINCMLEDQNKKLWFGTDAGVSSYDGKSFTNYTVAQGLIHNNVVCMLEDLHGNLWFGTKGGGISRYDKDGFISFSSTQGLMSNEVRAMKIDGQGMIWIGTNQGLCSLQFAKATENSAGQELQGAGALAVSNEELKTYTPVWKIYNNTSGYPVRDMFANAMTLTKVGLPKGDKKDLGVIWGGYGDDKVIRFDPSAVRNSTEPLSVFIESIRVKEEIIPWYSLSSASIDSIVKAQQEIMAFGRALLPDIRSELQNRFKDIKFSGISKHFPVPQNLVLPYKHNQVSFEFGAIETGRPKMVRYRYQLEGYDADWNPVTAKTSATYGNIFEGNYTFKVQAMNPDGIWSEPVNYRFRVLPPFWRSWWAYGFYGLCFIAGVIGIDRFQRRRLIEKERQKSREKELAQAREIEKAYTELKATQSQLIQSEKMASLGELTAGIAHEIQNPLNFVNNFSEINKELFTELESEIENGNQREIKAILKDLKDNEDKVVHHGKRADAIVKSMLQHSRTSSSEKELTDINALCDEYLRLAYHGFRAKDKSFNANFKQDLDESLPSIEVVPQDIGRVLLNLINNAFQACAERSRSALSSEASVKEYNDYLPEVIVSTKKLENAIEISVEDNGPGIPEEIKDKIFQPFFTTKPTGEGTGLGLSLTYDIVKAHGGEIKVKSDAGKGSKFILHLPTNDRL